jgi:hypothetical protein
MKKLILALSLSLWSATSYAQSIAEAPQSKDIENKIQSCFGDTGMDFFIHYNPGKNEKQELLTPFVYRFYSIPDADIIKFKKKIGESFATESEAQQDIDVAAATSILKPYGHTKTEALLTFMELLERKDYRESEANHRLLANYSKVRANLGVGLIDKSVIAQVFGN